MNNIISTTSHVMPKFPIHEAILILRKAGYSGIEIWHEDFEEQEQKKTTSIKQIKEAIEETGLKGVVHGPTKDILTGDKLNICSKDRIFRKASVEKYIESIALAKKLGFHLVNVHPGHMDHIDGEPEEYWPILKRSFETLAEAAEKADALLVIELMEQRPKEFIMHPEDMKRLITSLDSQNMGATLDIIHAFTHGEEFPLKHLEDLGFHLQHFHASGFYGIEGKTHCPFYLDKDHSKYFKNVLKEVVLSYDGIITIEGTIKGIIPETKENQLKVIKENFKFVRPIIGQ